MSREDLQFMDSVSQSARLVEGHYWLNTEEQRASNAQQPCNSRAVYLELEEKVKKGYGS